MTSTQSANPLPDWSDPAVQITYAILCDTTEPPKGEHWEGYTARQIVAALRASRAINGPDLAAEACND